MNDVTKRLLDVYDSGELIEPITSGDPSFDLGAAYAVLAEIEEHRRAQGWRPVGRKIGFTNSTLWELYGVEAPMWARMWDRTLIRSQNGAATVPLRFPETRIEPEIAFGLSRPLGPTDDPMDVLRATEWIAASFEVVWCPYPGWRFALPDCTAAFGLHGALVVGEPMFVTDDDRDTIADLLPRTRVTLRRGDDVVDEGVGSNVLGGPAHALAHLTRVLANQPAFEPLAAGEIVTTGTVTDAHAPSPGETWTSDYGELGLAGVRVTFS